MKEYQIKQICEITDRGFALFLEEEPQDLPIKFNQKAQFLVTKPDGSRETIKVVKEYARKISNITGEEAVLLIKETNKNTIPVGSKLEILEIKNK